MVRNTLTRPQIVEAAVTLLDAEGLEGLSMRALGASLGSAATAVYWHVDSKENLVALASDRVWSEIVLPDLETLDWRTAATELATGLHAMLTRHLWLLRAFGSFVTYGPGKARYDDHTFAVYETAGFRGAAIDRAASAVFTFVLGSALGLAAVDTMARHLDLEGPAAKKRMREMLVEARNVATQFPRLRMRLKTEAAAYGTVSEGSFAFGLEAILDGLDCALGAGQRSVARRVSKRR